MKNILGLLALSISFSSVSQKTVADAIRKSGRSDIWITLERSSTDSLALPVSVIKGALPGKTFAIVAGVHGFEYPPIVAVQEFLSEIDPKKLKGSLIVLPLANPASFFGRSPFVNPLDGKNLNNAFPGNKSGSSTEKIAHFITSEVISRSDYFLDIHAGDASEDLIPFVCYYDNKQNSEKTRSAEMLCEASGFENIVSYPYTISAKQPALYAFKQAVQDGKVALSIESGKLGNVQSEAISGTKEAIYRMLQAAGMYERKDLPVPQRSKNRYTNQSSIKCEQQGIFYSELKAGDGVKKGQKIARITDLFGKTIAEIFAPETGVILYKVGTPPVNKGETLFCIGIL